MKNYTERTVTIISPTAPHEVVAEYPSEGVRVNVTRAPAGSTWDHEGIPVVNYTPSCGVTGLEGITGDIIVPLVVAEGMRACGHRHKGRVFTPQQLIFAPGPERVALGAPGLIFHWDLSRLPVVREEE